VGGDDVWLDTSAVARAVRKNEPIFE